MSGRANRKLKGNPNDACNREIKGGGGPTRLSRGVRGGGSIRLSAAVLTALLLAVSPASAEEPPAPVLSATPGDSKVDLSWTDTGSGNSGPDTYQWRMRRATSSSWDNPTFAGSSRTESVTDLANGTDYKFQVRALRTTVAVSEDPPSGPNQPPVTNVNTQLRPGPWSYEVTVTPAAD